MKKENKPSKYDKPMTTQERAAALWKWGSLYPKIFPNAVAQSAMVYKQDRIQRGLEEGE